MGPRVPGYFPEMGFADRASLGVCAEPLLNIDGKGNLTPALATSWDVDTANKTITWHLREGVKFHDGTDWNAEAALWTFQITKDAGKLQYSELITSMEVIDDYTLRFNLTQYNNRLIRYFSTSIYYFSPTAFEINGKAWARTHPVGTGPFKCVEFKRDNYMKYEKFADYWRSGRPYLDGLDVRFIPQEMTASASMQAGEIDYWQGPAVKTTVLELREKGFKDENFGLFLNILIPDAKNPNSPFASKKVREAVEYAIDREAMAGGILLGLGEATYQVAPYTSPLVYDPNYKGRQYDPEKAKQLLAEAGYAAGFKPKLVTMALASQGIAPAIQNYLAAVGIEAEVDVADMGRFMTMVSEGWEGLLWNYVYASNPDYVSPFLSTLGPPPTTPAFPSMGRTPEYEALCEQIKSAQDDESEQAIVKKMIKQLGEDATVIPIFVDRVTPMWQPYVHPSIDAETGILLPFLYDWWMESH
jgi:peptide/nickel transport system substrate-binding protein